MHMANLTDEQKEVLDSARELRQAGDFEGAKKLIEEAGIQIPMRGGKLQK